MDWKQPAVQRLKNYETRRLALSTIPAQLETLEMQFTSIRGARTDGDPVSGGTNRREELLLANIQKRSELKANYKIAMREVEITEKGLDALTKEERRILELFYIVRPTDHISRLCDEFAIEKSEVYRRKDDALKKFTIAMYGVVEI